MKIGIDATSVCRQTTGLEKYTLRLVENILKQDKSARYVVFLRRYIPPELKKYAGRNIFAVSPFDNQFLCEQFWIPSASAALRLNTVLFPAFPPGLFYRRRFVAVVHDASVWKYPGCLSLKGKFYFKPLLSAAVKRADRVLTVSKAAAADIAACSGMDRKKIEHIYSAVGPEFGVVEDKRALERTRTKFNLPPSFLLHAGSIEPRKNLPFLLRVFRKTLQKEGMEGFYLVLAGKEAWGIKEVRREITGLGLERRVFLTGHVSDEELCHLYNLASVLVSPSVYEGFGLPVLEAMACGLPVAASDIPAHREIFHPAAMLAEPADEAGFSAVVAECALDEALRRKLARRGLEKSREFSWKYTAEKVVSLIQTLPGMGTCCPGGKRGSRL